MNNSYLIIYSCCILVKGAKKSIIIDLQRNSIYRFDSSWVKYLRMLKNTCYSQILNSANDLEEKENIECLKSFLLENELGFFTDTPESFPDIQFNISENNQNIENAIIDINNDFTYVAATLFKLNAVKCKYLQIRIFTKCNFDNIMKLLKEIEKYEFLYTELIIQYAEDLSIKNFNIFFQTSRSLQIIYVYNSPTCRKIEIGSQETKLKTVYFTTQEILNVCDCGNISKKAFTIPNLSLLSQRVKYNSCLYKKIAIDSNGVIKKCPSLDKCFGKITDCDLTDILKNNLFKKLETISKDKIEICKDCEYRYLCTDCRAYTVSDIYSKPLKCKYNPYLAIWEE